MDPSTHWLPPAPAAAVDGSPRQAPAPVALLGPEDPVDQGAAFKSPKRSWRNRLAAPFAALIAALAKLKALLLVLGNFKLVTTAGTMAVSVAAYSVLWGGRSRWASSCSSSSMRWGT